MSTSDDASKSLIPVLGGSMVALLAAVFWGFCVWWGLMVKEYILLVLGLDTLGS